jgi:hypothetical protein
VNHLLIQFGYLQLLDVMTTMAFLLNGVQEGNPLVRLALGAAPNPLTGLLVVKVFAMLLGLYCWQQGRLKLLVRVNVLFAVIVAWNLAALIVGSAAVA